MHNRRGELRPVLAIVIVDLRLSNRPVGLDLGIRGSYLLADCYLVRRLRRGTFLGRVDDRLHNRLIDGIQRFFVLGTGRKCKGNQAKGQ